MQFIYFLEFLFSEFRAQKKILLKEELRFIIIIFTDVFRWDFRKEDYIEIVE
jgi:hypothetical protein